MNANDGSALERSLYARQSYAQTRKALEKVYCMSIGDV
jgi:hypothetical protein